MENKEINQQIAIKNGLEEFKMVRIELLETEIARLRNLVSIGHALPDSLLLINMYEEELNQLQAETKFIAKPDVEIQGREYF